MESVLNEKREWCIETRPQSHKTAEKALDWPWNLKYLVAKDVPKQTNDHDCGPLCVRYLEYILNGNEVTIRKERIDDTRKRYIRLLEN
jgi:Ulp1 family protease